MTEESSAVTPVFQDKVLLLLCRMIWCDIAADWAKAVMPGVETLFWDPGEPWPSTLDTWQGDWLISFRGDLIVPEEVYRRARKGSLNFHPAPPRYRGLGSQFYAIYNGDTEFGTTCHHLAPSVDTGPIVRVDTFPIAPGETATSLRHRVGAYSLMQFFEIVTWAQPVVASDLVVRWDRMHRAQDVDVRRSGGDLPRPRRIPAV